MVDKSILVKSQVAFIFLLVTLASLAFANPICKCGNGDAADPPSKKVVNYNVRISESGEQYNETIEVDTEKQTELFKVPAHNNTDHSNILHDFKLNMSMLLLPEKKICYYLPLQKELWTPRNLINGLDTAERTVNKTSKTAIFDNKWIVDREMTNRSVLSDELAAFCAKYSIYYVKKMEESLNQTGGGKNRKRRQVLIRVSGNALHTQSLSYVIIEDEILCSGGKGIITGNDIYQCRFVQEKSWNVQCRITTHACYWMVVCPTFDYCYDNHLSNTVFCCEYICN